MQLALVLVLLEGQRLVEGREVDWKVKLWVRRVVEGKTGMGKRTD